MPILSSFKSKFITFEGIERSGKSTNIATVFELLRENGVDVITTREPGGTLVGEKIRDIVLGHSVETITPEAELLLFFASRAQHIHHVIKPALRMGKCVLCDRFTEASYAYQGGGRGISMHYIEGLENMVQGSLRPDLVLIFDVSVELSFARTKNRGAEDRIEIEQLEFFERVRNAYLERAKKNPSIYKIIDASKPLEELNQTLKDLFIV